MRINLISNGFTVLLTFIITLHCDISDTEQYLDFLIVKITSLNTSLTYDQLSLHK